MFIRRVGFTLVEMMIVIALIGILSVALIPQISSYLARGRDTERIAGIKDISLAVSAYQLSHKVLPSGTGASSSCVNESLLTGLYLNRFPKDPISTRLHGDCDIPGIYGYGTGIVLLLNRAVFSLYFENPNGGNTGTIETYQVNAITPTNMNLIRSMQKGSGSGYVVHN